MESKHIYSLLPVVPAPVYAIRHLLVDNSHNFIKESFPEDSKYWNPKLYDYSTVIELKISQSISMIICTCINFTQHYRQNYYLAVPREDHRAYFITIVRFCEGVHTSIRHAIPKFNATIFSRRSVSLCIWRIFDTRYPSCMLVTWYAAYETLCSIYVI